MSAKKSYISTQECNSCLFCISDVRHSPILYSTKTEESFSKARNSREEGGNSLEEGRADVERGRDIMEEGSDNVQEEPRPRMILLISSVPRSGSSFIGQLLASPYSSVYFFEPNHMIKDDACLYSTECLVNYLLNKFTCEFDHIFKNWLFSHPLFVSFFNNKAYECSKLSDTNRAMCLHSLDIKRDCSESHYRIIKIIRGRLDSLELLIQDNSIDVRIVHLHRDPRGFMRSISRFRNWNKNSTRLCSNLVSDLVAYQRLEAKYPNILMQISYEKFSRNPLESTKLLFEHVFGNGSLPVPTIEYLKKHTEGTNIPLMPMSTIKNTKTIYQDWRNRISEDLLDDIEKNEFCKTAIKILGHRLFDSIVNVRNLSMPLLL